MSGLGLSAVNAFNLYNRYYPFIGEAAHFFLGLVL